MSEIARLERSAAGRTFVVEVGGDAGLRCVVSQISWNPMGETLCVIWSRSPREYVVLLEEARGIEIEEYYGWVYADDEPDVLVPGSVRVHMGEDECVVTQKEFEAFAVELALALIALGKGPAELAPRLRAVLEKKA